MNKHTMAGVKQPSTRWGVISCIAAVIICQLIVSVVSSDPSDSESPEVPRLLGDSAPKRPPQVAASGPVFSTEGTPSSPTPTGPSSRPTSTVAHLSSVSKRHSSLAHVADDGPAGSSSGWRGRRGPWRPALRKALRRRDVPSRRQAPSCCQARFSTARRVLSLLVILFFTALTGTIVYNFKPLAWMMTHDKAYAELCPLNSTSSNDTSSVQQLVTRGSENNETLQSGLVHSQRYLCDAQEAQIEGFYTVAFAIGCISSFVAGPLIDSAGSRVASSVGHLSEIIGLVLFAYGQYAGGLALVAAGQQTAYLASLSLAQMFPQSGGLILGLLGALASLSALVPSILKLLVSESGFTVREVTAGYAVVASLPALLAGIGLLPSKRASASTGDGAASDPSGRDLNEDTVPRAEGIDTLSPLTAITAGPSEATPESAGESARLPQLRGALRRILGSIRDFFADPALRENIFAIPTVFITLNFVIATVTSSYFMQGAERIFSGPARNLLQYFSPAAALPCALLGLIPDRLGASMASLILALAGLIMNGVSFYSSDVAGYASLVALTVYISALTSQVHWTSKELYPTECRSTVSGLILSVGGILSLVANWLYSTVTLGMLDGDTSVVRLSLSFLQFLQLVLIYAAYRRIQVRNGAEDRVAGALRSLLRRGQYSLAGDRELRRLPDS